MPIKLLKQNLEYFKYPNNVIKSVEIDTRFNDIVNYLNDEIIYKLNNLNDNIIVGSLLQIDINSILKSNTDVGYKWKKINNDDFTDNSINIKKLNYKNTVNSIFINSSNGDINQIQNQDRENNIILCDTNGIKFDRLNNNYIDENTKITSDKIAYNSISGYNLSNINSFLLENKVIDIFIKDSSIYTKHILNNSITIDCFNNYDKDILNNYIITTMIPKNFIDLNNIGNRDNIINNWNINYVNKFFGHNKPIGQYKDIPYKIQSNKFSKFYIRNIIKYYTNYSDITDLSLIDPNGKKVGAEKRYIISSNSFKPNSINANRLICWFNKQNDDSKCYNINDVLAKNSITIDHLSQAIKEKLN